MQRSPPVTIDTIEPSPADRFPSRVDDFGPRSSETALEREIAILRRRDEAHLKKIRLLEEELQQAADLQRNLLPTSLPNVEGLYIETFYRPAQVVSGDLYDVVRLDDFHVAMVLVDATGHGLAPALLSAFAKRSLLGRRSIDGPGRFMEPDEALIRLNRDILEMNLEECEFVTVLHALYNEKTRVIRWARGGASYPIHMRPGQSPRPLVSHGPIVGVFDDAHFEVASRKLEPGDTFLLHSDGLESLLLDRDHSTSQGALARTQWFHSLSGGPVAEHLDELDRRMAAAKKSGDDGDDITVLALRAEDRGANKLSLEGGEHADRHLTSLEVSPILA